MPRRRKATTTEIKGRSFFFFFRGDARFFFFSSLGTFTPPLSHSLSLSSFKSQQESSTPPRLLLRAPSPVDQPINRSHPNLQYKPPKKKSKAKAKAKGASFARRRSASKKKKKTRWRRRRPPLPHRAAPSSPRTPPGTPPSTWASAGPSTARWVGSSPPRCSSVSVVEMRLVAGEEGEKIHRESSRFSTSTS